jgi:hypothetical protein
MKPRTKRAKRRQIAHTRYSECDCVACREREQLRDVAAWHPAMDARICALTLLGAMDAIFEGRLGSATVEELFD